MFSRDPVMLKRRRKPAFLFVVIPNPARDVFSSEACKKQIPHPGDAGVRDDRNFLVLITQVL